MPEPASGRLLPDGRGPKSNSPPACCQRRVRCPCDGRRRLDGRGLHVVCDGALDAPHPGELRILAVLTVPVKDGLAVTGDLEDAGIAGGDGDCYLVAQVREDLGGYPSRLREVASRHAVGDLHNRFAFHDTLLGKVVDRVVWAVRAVNGQNRATHIRVCPPRPCHLQYAPIVAGAVHLRPPSPPTVSMHCANSFSPLDSACPPRRRLTQFQQVTSDLLVVRWSSPCAGGPLIGMDVRRRHSRTATP